MPGGIQPSARSVSRTVVSSGRSPAAHASRDSCRATASTMRCNRIRDVASAEAAPATAPSAPAATALPAMPVGAACWDDDGASSDRAAPACATPPPEPAAGLVDSEPGVGGGLDAAGGGRLGDPAGRTRPEAASPSRRWATHRRYRTSTEQS